MPPVTKEEVKVEKERLMAINAKAPKKILEAQFRKKKRVAKQMQKAKQKAQQIMDQDGISENLKLRQVQKLYNKSKNAA